MNLHVNEICKQFDILMDSEYSQITRQTMQCVYTVYMPRYRNYMNDEPFRHSLFISPFKNFIHVKQFIIQIKNITTTINGTLTFVKTNKIQLVEKAC